MNGIVENFPATCPPGKVRVIYNGQVHLSDPGLNVIDFAKSIGKEIPHYCYHPRLTVSGNCRMCLIEMGSVVKDRATGEIVWEASGAPKIQWGPRPGIACTSKTTDGLCIRTDSPIVKDCREGVMEFLLLNHPLDCPICDQAGECSLQEFATDYGRGYSRSIEEKNVKPKRTQLGPRVTLDDERCILCSRCIRFCDEIIKEPVLGFIDRGSYSTLTCYPGKELRSNYSLNTVDLCPVGALTSTDFRFQMRVWFLKQTPSICTESSVGVNTTVWTREGKIYRITPRENSAVNDSWMSDSGRELYKLIEADNRVHYPCITGNKVRLADALDRALELIHAGPQVGYVMNGHASLEDHYALAALRAVYPGKLYFMAHIGSGDGLLISEDRTPNARGAWVSGLTNEAPLNDTAQLQADIESGQLNTLIILNEDLVEQGLPESALKHLHVIYLGTQSNATAARAHVLIPTLTVFEKSGSFVNQQYRLQKFMQAIPGPVGALPDWMILGYLRDLLAKKGDQPSWSLDQLWSAMESHCSALTGLSFAKIPAMGVQLDGSAWQHLKTPETKSLHYTAP